MPITIKDIAEEAKVAPSTVSHIINGPSKNIRISEKTKQRVLDIVRKVGYVPSFYAQTMRQKGTFSIGMVASSIRPYNSLVIDGVNAKVAESGYHLLIGVSSDDPKREQFYISNFLSRRVDGLLINPAPSGETLPKLEELSNRGVPLVLCGGHPPVLGKKVDHVANDIEAGSYMAVNYLIELGHKRIAFCTGHPTWLPSRTKYRGYRQALEDKGWGVDNGLCVQVDNSDYAAGLKCGRALVEMENRPDAALFHNDVMAMGAISVLRDAKIKVPDDFSVIAFGNISVAETQKVSLTTISLATYKVGQKAAEVLLEKIKTQKQKSISDIAEKWAPQAIRLMPELIIRETTAPRKL